MMLTPLERMKKLAEAENRQARRQWGNSSAYAEAHARRKRDQNLGAYGASGGRPPNDPTKLTPQAKRVKELLGQGFRTFEVAEEMGISAQGVSSYKKRYNL